MTSSDISKVSSRKAIGKAWKSAKKARKATGKALMSIGKMPRTPKKGLTTKHLKALESVRESIGEVRDSTDKALKAIAKAGRADKVNRKLRKTIAKHRWEKTRQVVRRKGELDQYWMRSKPRKSTKKRKSIKKALKRSKSPKKPKSILKNKFTKKQTEMVRKSLGKNRPRKSKKIKKFHKQIQKAKVKLVVGKVVKFINGHYLVCHDSNFNNLVSYDKSTVEKIVGFKDVPLGTKLILRISKRPETEPRISIASTKYSKFIDVRQNKPQLLARARSRMSYWTSL